jgi:hypothetical protein
VTAHVTLKAFAFDSDELVAGVLDVPFKGAVAPKVIDNFRRLERLGLLTGEVVLALLGQAPLDPIGVYGALKHTGVWAFNALDFTVVQVLAKKKDMPVAVMRIDLLSDDIVFVAMQKKQLVQVSGITADEMEAKMKEPGMNESYIMAWIKKYIDDTVALGLTG